MGALLGLDRHERVDAVGPDELAVAERNQTRLTLRHGMHKIRRMAYTKLNLKEDVQDSAPSFGFAPDMEARFASSDLELEESGMGYERLTPNFRVPFGHTHKGQEELYVVASGSGRMKIDDEIVELKQWDAIRVPAGRVALHRGGPRRHRDHRLRRAQDGRPAGGRRDAARLVGGLGPKESSRGR